MRLLVIHNSVLKICQNCDSYQQLLNFVHKNYPGLSSPYSLTYKDSDNDLISLSSQLDFDIMNETVNNQYVKVYIQSQDAGDKYQQNLSVDQSLNQSQIQPQKEKEQGNREDQIKEGNAKIEEVSSNIKEKQQNSAQEPFSHPSQKYQSKPIEQDQPDFYEEPLKPIDVEVQQKEKIPSTQIQPTNLINEAKIADLITTQLQKKVKKFIPTLTKKIQQELKRSLNAKEQQNFSQGQENNSEGEKNKNKASFKDPKLLLTKKCFQLAHIFGGEPQEYKSFVEAHLQLSNGQLVSLFREKNPDCFKIRIGQRLINSTKKLAFYYGSKPQFFIELVKQFPNALLPHYIKKIKQGQYQIPNIEHQESNFSEKQEKKKSLEKDQTKKEPVQQGQAIQKKEEQLPKKEERQQQKNVSNAKIEHPSKLYIPDDPVKRDQVILTLKDYFGAQYTYEYVNFYNHHKLLSAERIVEEYCKMKFN